MKKFTKELVNEYADKLLIGLTDEENELVLKEFDIIEESMELIANIKGIEQVEVMTHALDNFTYTLKEDIKEESLAIDDILKNCKKYEDREIIVPRIIGDDNNE